ncbi:hypothetical protein Tco_0153438 [Tanacetum coccineum]
MTSSRSRSNSQTLPHLTPRWWELRLNLLQRCSGLLGLGMSSPKVDTGGGLIGKGWRDHHRQSPYNICRISGMIPSYGVLLGIHSYESESAYTSPRWHYSTQGNSGSGCMVPRQGKGGCLRTGYDIRGDGGCSGSWAHSPGDGGATGWREIERDRDRYEM